MQKIGEAVWQRWVTNDQFAMSGQCRLVRQLQTNCCLAQTTSRANNRLTLNGLARRSFIPISTAVRCCRVSFARTTLDESDAR